MAPPHFCGTLLGVVYVILSRVVHIEQVFKSSTGHLFKKFKAL
jgi:hypothetical protein